MPIIQIRASKQSQYLSAPFPPVPDQVKVIREWQKSGWDSELIVYPDGYMGNVSPVAWRESSNSLLHVSGGGEQAEMLMTGRLPDQKTPADLIAELQNADPEVLRAIGSIATVDSKNKTVFISAAVEQNRLAIGGIVLHAEPQELAFLRRSFPETPVQMPDGS